MTLQEKLAQRIYELLPHKKEFVLGTQVLVTLPPFGEPSDGIEYSPMIQGIATYIEPDEPMTFLSGNHIYDVYPSDFKNGATEYVDDEDGIVCEIIGQPLRLAEILIAVDKADNAQISLKSRLHSNFTIATLMLTKNNKHLAFTEYNLSKDNILDQSDEFCEFVLQLLK